MSVRHQLTTTPGAPSGDTGAQQLWLIAIGLVTLSTIAMRIVDISFSFDGDEVFSVNLASDSWSEVISGSLADNPHPPLHNILLHFWLLLWGVSEQSARMLSVLMSTASVLIVMHILRGRVRPFVGLTAGLVIACSGFLIYYGQQARPYALVALVGSLNLLTFRRLLAAPGEPGRATAWAVTALLIGYTHYIGAIYLAVEACVLLLLLRLDWRPWVRAVGPAVIGAALVLPWMWAAFRDNPRLETIEWIDRPDLRTLALFYIRAIGRPVFLSGWIFVVTLASLVGTGAWRVWKSSRHVEDALVLAAIAFAPALVCFALSQGLAVSVWAPRQLILSALAFIALLAILVDALPARARAIGCGVLITWAVAGASEGFASALKPAWSRIVGRIEAADAHATILAQERWTLRPLLYYANTASVQSVQTATSLAAPATDGPLYFVCRPPNCEFLAGLERSFGPASEIARDATGGDLNRVVVTYRLQPPPADQGR